MSSSASRSARGSSVARLLLACALGLALGAPAPAAAQGGFSQVVSVVVVDWRRALSESRVGRALQELEAEERRAARAALDDLKASLEAEEAELARLKETMPRAEFDVRVRDFDQRVRRARRSAQETSAALQARFGAARSALEETVRPVLAALMRERGASLALDMRGVLLASPQADATDALIARLDTERPASSAAGLLPPTTPAPPPPASP